MAVGVIVAGLALIVIGADALTDGASAIAKRFKVSNLVIGLTVVAFGTSAPEMAVSLISAVKGSPDMAVGNVVGSNIFNTLLILGCTATIVPLGMTKGTVAKEIPLCLLCSLALFFCANDVFFTGATANVISRSDGLVLLCFFLIFLGYTFAIAHNGVADETVEVKNMKTWKSALFIVGGLAGLVFGGQIFVEGSAFVARAFGVGESVIALTLVAGGTSFPELATSVAAAIKKNPGMAIGNVVGSNIFNILFILGLSSSIFPLEVEGITMTDYSVMIGSCIMLYLFGILSGRLVIKRWEGVVMLVAFFAYMVYLLT
ncbi:MAG: calcium/sodium antiporter [Tannerella sp.]|nr:calcium/sodium antiporter [Tannerella sp.]